jgi:hypothetical protein
MPDWPRLVRQRLGPLLLSPEGEQEVLAEVATHLEDDYREQIEAGVLADQAVQATLAQVSDWKRFRRELQHSKEDPMNHRTRALWLPGAFTCLFSYLALALMVRAGLQPQYVWRASEFGIAGIGFYLPWFAPLPIVGALGAWWSRRAGGTLRERLLAVLLPAISMAVLFVIGLFWALIFERHPTVPKMLADWLLALLAWAAFPGAGLLLGALPFLGSAPARSHPAPAQT